MKRETTRRAASAFWARRGLTGKAERITKGRVAGRTRRVRMRAVLARMRSVLGAYATQLKRRSPRAITALFVALILIIGIPIGIGMAIKNHKPAEVAAPQTTPNPEQVVMDLGGQTLSSGTQGASAQGMSALSPTFTASPTPSPTPEPHPSTRF